MSKHREQELKAIRAKDVQSFLLKNERYCSALVELLRQGGLEVPEEPNKIQAALYTKRIFDIIPTLNGWDTVRGVAASN